jgi:acetylornithine aminotransferase
MVDGFEFFKSVQDIENQILTSSENDLPVAVILELVQGEGGIQALPKKDVQSLAKTLKSKNILLIIDEVQTGIYRTGEFLTSQIYEIEPDIITLAKGLGGGIPIGAMVTKLKDGFEAGDHGSTFGGNYLSTRAGLEVCNILEEYKNSGLLDENFIYFEEKLKELAQKYPKLFEEVAGFGMMRALRCKAIEIQNLLYKEAHNEKVLVLKAGRNSIRFLPPLTITKEEMKKGFERFEAVLKRVSE